MVKLRGIFGIMGSFKTALCVGYAIESLWLNKPVYTNFKIDLAGVTVVSLSELLKLGKLKSGTIIVDELYAYADSRVSSSRVNRMFSYFIFQSRKLGVDVIYTSQLDSSVDLRTFELTTEKILANGLDDSGQFVDYDIEYEDGEVDDFSLPLWYFKENVFPVYDTNEIIEPVNVEELLVELEKTNPEIFNKRIDDAVDLLLKKGINKKSKLFKYDVDNFMVRAGLPENLSSYVYDRLKSEHNL